MSRIFSYSVGARLGHSSASKILQFAIISHNNVVNISSRSCLWHISLKTSYILRTMHGIPDPEVKLSHDSSSTIIFLLCLTSLIILPDKLIPIAIPSMTE